jgi:hypothetical protein
MVRGHSGYADVMTKKFELSASRHQNDPAFLYWYGVALERAGRAEEASQSFDRAEREARAGVASSDLAVREENTTVLDNLEHRKR